MEPHWKCGIYYTLRKMFRSLSFCAKASASSVPILLTTWYLHKKLEVGHVRAAEKLASESFRKKYNFVARVVEKASPAVVHIACKKCDKCGVSTAQS